MFRLMNPLRILSVLAIAASLLLTGCFTTSTGIKGAKQRKDTVLAADVLRKDDMVVITFANVPPPLPLPHEEKIKDDGNITLALIGSIKAEGKTSGQLQKEIQDAYVPKYYRNMTITVKAPERSFYVQGEVKIPNRYQLTTGTTVLKAITSAGGFTDFAKRTDVELTSSTGVKYIIDCKEAQTKPEFDLPIYPDDRLNVPKRLY